MYMNLSVRRIVELPEVPSASGVEMCQGRIYIVGDDGQYLYICDQEGRYISSFGIFNGPYEPGEKIPKNIKPDFEATFIYHSLKTGNDRMVILGSGSKPNGNRDAGYVVRFSSDLGPQKYTV
jgi:hypothetical protein